METKNLIGIKIVSQNNFDKCHKIVDKNSSEEKKHIHKKHMNHGGFCVMDFPRVPFHSHSTH